MAKVFKLNEAIRTDGLTTDLKELSAELGKVEQKFVTLIKSSKNINESIQKQTATQSNTNKAIKQTNKNVTELTALEKERINIVNQTNKVLAKGLTIDEKKNKTLIKGKAALQQRNQVLKNQAKLERLATTEGQKLNKTLIEQRKQLRKATTSGGGFIGSLKSMATGFLGVTALIYGAIRAIGSAVKISVSFEKQMDKVAAITGASSAEIKALSDNAKELGGTTTQTATQVGQLQEEFAKLGFSTKEILEATGATIALAEAAGADLSQAAVVAASTIRGFGLEASETQRIVDVMAKSFSSSSLDITKFQTAMAQVAPAAKASGIEIEQATALLGTLTDAGLDASIAGTSLRNIFLENAKSGRTLEQSLNLIEKSTNKNATAMELFGKRGAIAGLVLADNTEKTAELAEELDNAAGSAQEMADIMRDNLAGDVTILKSAWEGFILSMEDGEGVFNKVSRGFIKGLTKLVIAVTGLRERFVESFNEMIKSSAVFRAVVSTVVGLVRLNFKGMINTVMLAIEPFILLGRVIKDALTGNWDNIRNTVGKSMDSIKNRVVSVKDAFIDTGKTIVAAFKGDNIEQFLIKSKDSSDAALEFSKSINKVTTATKDLTEAAVDLEKKRREAEANRKKGIADEIQALRTQADIIILEEKRKLLGFKGTGEERAKAFEELSNFILQTEIDLSLKELEIANLTADEKLAIEKELVNQQIELQNKAAENYKENAKLKDAINSEEFAVSMDIANAAFDIGSSLRERELVDLQTQKDQQLALVGDNADARERIEKQFAAKEAEVKTRQAKSDKAQALFNAAISTAAAIVKALPNIPLSILMGILGGVQIAAIAAKPIPKFAKGVKGFKGGVAEYGEAGAEIVSLPTGDSFLAENKTVGWLPKDTDIIPNYETEKILAEHGGVTGEKFNELISEVKKGNNQPTHITNVTEKGFEYYSTQGNTRIKWVNKYLHR